MSLRASVIACLAACVVEASAHACILPADPAEAARIMDERNTRDRKLQAALGGETPTYRASPSIPPLACTMPSEIFRNTITVTGETYLLYVRGGRLLRAKSATISPADLTVNEELKLIAEASDKSLQRARER